MSGRPEGELPPAALDLATVRERLSAAKGREYWRSLEELAATPEFGDLLAREFPRHASEWDEGVSRRRFVELMGASLALGGLAACTKQPEEAIVPYVNQPETVLPGRPLFFATAMAHAGYATGLLVESHTGRPTKIEGNPDHPSSLGATDAFAQASVLTLYDPDRSQTVTKLGAIRTFDAFLEELTVRMGPHRALSGEGLRILTQSVSSPTLADQLAALLAAMPKARWHSYDPITRDAVRAGARTAFGQPVETRYDFSRADVVVTLDGDPFGAAPGGLRYAREFARRRTNAERMPRFYAAESVPTVSGTLADHRLPIPAGEIPVVALALAAASGVSGAVAPSGLDAERAGWVKAAAADLAANRGRSVVVPGETAPAAVHAVAHAINAALGNGGATVIHTDSVEPSPMDQMESLKQLVADMNAGKVDTLLILGGNPVFDAPADLSFAEALRKVAFRAHLSLYEDETSAYCQWHVHETHFLEAWSDARAHDGTVSIVQPLIEPMYSGRSAHEMLSALLDPSPRPGLEIVRAYWQRQRPGAGFEATWRRALHDGLVAGTELPLKSVAPRPDGIREAFAALAAFPVTVSGLELSLRPDPGIWDGRFANNGWLMELPRPHTKLTWDNAAYVSLETARALGVSTEDVVTIEAGGRKVDAPIWVLPGHPDRSITLHLGFGRTRAGRVGTGAGVDAYALRTTDRPWTVPGVKVTKTGRTHPLATTQTHFNMEGRALVRSGTAERFRKDPEFARKMGETPLLDESLYPPFAYANYAWGLAVNLSTCTGCSACVVACQAENNIPIVGKDQVRRGREMHWLRIDRYYEGSASRPAVHNQPVMCMHCEKAPCEVVCPVAATTHSEEGLNEMTYNRCVGTKYCSNNCPYKVRRFNFYELNADKKLPSLTLLANPNVTVRSRGVMEKCTFCVQRINMGRIAAERENRKVRDGEIRTACMQVCPTEAIVFGDQNDPGSRVAKLKQSPLNYGLLAELNTRPRTTYLAKLTNPNPSLKEG